MRIPAAQKGSDALKLLSICDLLPMHATRIANCVCFKLVIEDLGYAKLLPRLLLRLKSSLELLHPCILLVVIEESQEFTANCSRARALPSVAKVRLRDLIQLQKVLRRSLGAA